MAVSREAPSSCRGPTAGETAREQAMANKVAAVLSSGASDMWCIPEDVAVELPFLPVV